jgi:hypothetical protein
LELTFNVTGQKITRTDQNENIINKTRDYVQLIITFDNATWTDYEKYLILTDECGKNYEFELGTNNRAEVTIPEKVLYGGLFKLGCYGTLGDVRLTTNVKVIGLTPSAYTTDITPVVDPSEDIFERIDEDIHNLQVSITNVYTKVEADANVESEIKKGYRTLRDNIRTYGA